MATSALDALTAMFAQFGLQSLATQVHDLAMNPDLTATQKYTAVYDLPAYKERFPAMAELQKRGEAIDEGTYISQERAYRDALYGAGLPKGFYDSNADFAKWMVGAVSPAELAGRIKKAQRIVDSADPGLRQAAFDYYGVDKDHLLAYAINPEKAQPLIDRQMQSVEAGAAASRYQFQLDRAAAESLVTSPLVESLDPASLAQRFGQARDLANTDARLSSVEGQAYNQQDAIDAVLKDNTVKQMESRSRADREQARFSGTAGGVNSKSLRSSV